jgi:hypothetical protein
MTDNQKHELNNPRRFQEVEESNVNPANNEETPTESTPANEDSYTAGNNTPEIAANDGSVIETLDTAFHGTPGWSEGENISGSNRADYYEARSNGKSDVEEELDELREKNKSAGSKKE